MKAFEEAMSKADLRKAEERLAVLEKSQGQDVAVQVARARVTAAKGEVEKAEKALAKLVKEHPGSGLAKAYYGSLLVVANKFKEARPLLEQAIKSDGNVPAAHHALGIVLSSQGQDSQALPHLEQAAKEMPSSAPVHFFLGVCLAQLGKWDPAAESFLRSVTLDPKYVNGHEALARVLVEMKDPQKATAALGNGLKANPGDSGLLRLQARIYYDFGHPEEARKALESMPSSARSSLDSCQLANICLETGAFVDAFTHAQAAVRADEKNGLAHYLSGLAMEASVNRPLANIIKAYERAVELGDPAGEAGTRLGFVVLEADPKATAKSIAVLEAARKRSHDAPGTLLNLAIAHAKAGDSPRSKACAEKVVQNPAATPAEKEQAERLAKMAG